jgi:hypothetical protein
MGGALDGAVRRIGDDMRELLKPDVDEWFLLKTSPEPNTGCWLWREHVGNCGYALVRPYLHGKNRTMLAHRLSYELFKGPIPMGLTIDHLCRVKSCVNPAHLEAVSNRVNQFRNPQSLTGNNSRKICCLHGHPFSGANLYMHGTNRHCRACRRANSQQRKRLDRRNRGSAIS